MRLIFSLLIILSITSCTVTEAKTPSQRYYAMKALYKDLLNAAVIYKEDCDLQESYNDCHKYVEKIKDLNNHVRDAFKSADNAGAKTNKTIGQEVLTGADVALKEMYEYMIDVGAWKNDR